MCREFHRVMREEGPSQTTLFRYAKGKGKRQHVITERYVREAIQKVTVELRIFAGSRIIQGGQLINSLAVCSVAFHKYRIMGKLQISSNAGSLGDFQDGRNFSHGVSFDQ